MNDDSESGSQGGSASGDAPTGGSRRAPDALAGQVIADRYRVERTVSLGAHTVITDATDTELGRLVTLKLIRPEFSEVPDFQRRFDQTMHAMSVLSHPNIAAVQGWGLTTVAHRTTCYVVVEYLSGGSLRDLFDRGRYISPSQALVVGLEACRALDHAHRRSIIHTEITPSKLVFGEDRRLRIIDFGLARLLGMAAWSDPAMLPTHTARYASPEQAQRQPLDGKTDVYALALTLAEAVTGSVPFAADSTAATLAGRIGKLMPVSADLGSLAAELERAGRPDREGRWTAAEFGRALVRAAAALSRPEPLPLIVTSLFTDTPLREPDDPTGGLERPPEPEPPIEDESPDDAAASEEPYESTPDASIGAPGTAGEPTTSDAAEAAPGTDERDDAAPPAAPVPPPPPLALPGEPLAVRAPRAPDLDPQERDSGTTAPAPPAEAPSPAAEAPSPAAEAPSPATEESSPATEELSPLPPPAPAPEVAAAPATEPDVPAGDAGTSADDAESETASSGSAKPVLYDGEDDVTRDELAQLAVSTPSEEDATTVAATVSSGEGAIPPPDGGVGGDDPGEGPADGGSKLRWSPRILVGALLLIALGALAVTGYLLFRAERHEVPELTGLSEDDARLLVEDYEWNIETRAGRSDEVPDEGNVIRTEPAAGEQLAEGGEFLLIISEGPELRDLPDLREMTRPEALRRLESVQLSGSVARRVFDEEVPPGQVVRWRVVDDPDLGVGDSVLPGTEIELVMSKGPAPREVPDLRDMSPREAQTILDDLRLEMEQGERAFHETIAEGNVAEQRPQPGSELERGETVTIRVSKGPDLVEFPNLQGLGERQARQRLENAGFELRDMRGAVRQGSFERAMVARGHDTPADDCEAGSNIQAGKQCLRGTPIVLVYLL